MDQIVVQSLLLLRLVSDVIFADFYDLVAKLVASIITLKPYFLRNAECLSVVSLRCGRDPSSA